MSCFEKQNLLGNNSFAVFISKLILRPTILAIKSVTNQLGYNGDHCIDICFETAAPVLKNLKQCICLISLSNEY